MSGPASNLEDGSPALSWNWQIRPLSDPYLWHRWARITAIAAALAAAVAGTLVVQLSGWRGLEAVELYALFGAGGALWALGYCVLTVWFIGPILVHYAIDERGASRTLDAASWRKVDGADVRSGMGEFLVPPRVTVTWRDQVPHWDRDRGRIVVRRGLRPPLPIHVPAEMIPAVDQLMTSIADSRPPAAP